MISFREAKSHPQDGDPWVRFEIEDEFTESSHWAEITQLQVNRPFQDLQTGISPVVVWRAARKPQASRKPD